MLAKSWHSTFDWKRPGLMRKRAYVKERKLALNACQMCQLEITPRTHFLFDLDHLDRSQKNVDLCAMTQQSVTTEIINKEIEKCRLLCCNCHRLHTRVQCNYSDVTTVAPD